MALPRSIQFMGLLSLVLFLYLVAQIFKAPTSVSRPGAGQRLEEMTRDPNLDRLYSPIAFNHAQLMALSSNWRA